MCCCVQFYNFYLIQKTGEKTKFGCLDTIFPERDIKAHSLTVNQIYLDGGITLGTDVLKAIALGAKMVFVGRPVLWGLAYDGQKGVERVLEILRLELDMAMALAGIEQIDKIKGDFVALPKSVL